ncbi:hypothetical protein BAY61_27865 [Prauserella marina]|uniref:Uncharacterized protein n=1 Tax=Prauserella marina TaxID=530584 RepID=A0A222W0M1_9PSEU|nr:DUF2537 domain-containing protein [Prauserella marina]ASR39729.1 hypothetical protein BAY61_27865 [Prauserella marina]PWV78629.1 uncharacterized protein DUF2537 [Prauserella marina]SDC90306.1 Protein of unknown function [Prauserella marina]
MRLLIKDERVVLVGGENGTEADPHGLALAPDLAEALHEWAKVASAVRRTGSGQGSEVVSQRGKQLAGRVALAMGVPVEYRDPFTGEAHVVAPPEEQERRYSAERLVGSRAAIDEKTPWGTGLTVAGFLAVFVAVAMLALANALATETTDWVAVGAGVVVTGGLAPSLWLGRAVPIVRWIVLGAAAGVVAAWIGLLVIAFR